MGTRCALRRVPDHHCQAQIAKDKRQATTLKLALRPDLVALAIDDVEYLVERLEWSSAPRRIYLGATRADTLVEWISYVPADRATGPAHP